MMEQIGTSTPVAASPNRGITSRLSVYAATASGAVLAGAAGSSAEAAVVIVDIATQDATNNFTIDLAAAGSGFAYTFSNIGLTAHFYGRVSATNQNDASQFVANGGLVGTGVFLDSNDSWSGGTVGVNFPAAGQTGYLGFRLTVGEGASRYGWIEYVNDGTSKTVSRWAYESALDTGITTPTATAVPGGAGLAALAFGAAGVRGRRRHRN